MPRSTAQLRVKGIESKRESTPPNRLLAPIQEDVLVQWILSMDQRGMPPRIATVRQMTAILAAQTAASSAKPVHVGQNWVQKFVRRHDSLKSQFNRKYDYQRAKCEDPTLLRAWFKRVKDTKIQYGILDDDV